MKRPIPFFSFPFFPFNLFPLSPEFFGLSQGLLLDPIAPGEEVMIAAMARQVNDGDWAACGTLSLMPTAG